MSTASADAGVIGMAVMGRNLAKDIESRGYTVAIYNRSWEKTQEVLEWEHGKNARFVASKELADFVASIKRPRRIIIMVQAGKGTDAVIEQIAPLLEEGDILVDGGNAHWADTDRRAAKSANVRLLPQEQLRFPPGPRQERRDRQRSVTIFANLLSGQPGEALEAIEARAGVFANRLWARES